MYLRTLFLLGLLLLPTPSEGKTPKKLYISNESVILSNQEIIIEHEQYKYHATALYQGTKGLYVYYKDLTPLQPKLTRWWRCWSCGLWNWTTYTYCETCNMPRKTASQQDKEMLFQEDPEDVLPSQESLKQIIEREIKEWNDRTVRIAEQKREWKEQAERELKARQERRRKEDEEAGEESISDKINRAKKEFQAKREEARRNKEHAEKMAEQLSIPLQP